MARSRCRALAPAFSLSLLLVATALPATDDHLLLCEVAVSPTAGEFVEIVNPTSAILSLAGVYLADDADYALLPGAFGAGPGPTIASSDFIVAFPSATTLAPCGVIVVARNGTDFFTTHGFRADFEIFSADPATPDMIPTLVGSTAGLTDSGESAVLFFWDGASDLVADLDQVNVGTPTEANAVGDKTGLSVDGPDVDTTASPYLPDLHTMPLQPSDPGTGSSTKRLLLEGPSEVTGGGNGVTGDDETSEQILVTWDTSFITADPGSCPLPPECYYASVDPYDSITLRSTLAARIAGHQRLAWSESLWQMLELADQDPVDPASILDLYHNATYSKDRIEYQREHTWPSSFGFPEETDPPYTDCHMLFLADGVYNQARSNHPYRACTAPSCEEYPTLANHGQGGPPPPRENSNWEAGNLHEGSWETWIGRRGDVSRALFYMDVRYAGDAGEPDLILTDDPALIQPTGPGATEGYMGLLSTLLAWHLEDPVDDLERIRNGVVYHGQRNRNPFIDHPEWVACVFDGFCPIFADGFESGDTGAWSGVPIDVCEEHIVPDRGRMRADGVPEAEAAENRAASSCVFAAGAVSPWIDSYWSAEPSSPSP